MCMVLQKPRLAAVGAHSVVFTSRSQRNHNTCRPILEAYQSAAGSVLPSAYVPLLIMRSYAQEAIVDTRERSGLTVFSRLLSSGL